MSRLIPVVLVLLCLIIWQAAIHVWDVPVYLMPSPDRVFMTLVTDFSTLMEDFECSELQITTMSCWFKI